MKTLALTGIQRQLITRLHRWSGLFLLIFMLIVGITGAVLAFRWETDRALNPRLFSVVPAGNTVAYQRLIDVVEQRFPEAMVSSVVVPKAPADSVIIYIKSKMESHMNHVHVPGMKSSVDFNQIFVNPYSGEILGQRSSTRFVPTWEHIVPILARFHSSLYLNETGAWLLGIAAAVWLITSLFGLVLAWPSPSRSWTAWKSMLTVTKAKGRHQFNYRLHRVSAVVTVPILVVVAFTSVYLNLPNLVRPAVGWFSPVFAPSAVPAVESMALDAPRVTMEQAITTARDLLPNARVQAVGRDFLKGLYSVRMQLPDDVSATGNNTIYVTMRNAKVVFQRRYTTGTAGDVFLAWQWPLHTGKAFGLLGQILILVSAIALVVMCFTGFNVWKRLRSAKSRSRRVARANDAITCDAAKCVEVKQGSL